MNRFYVMRAKCGHVIALSVDPGADESEWQNLLDEWVKPILIDGGSVTCEAKAPSLQYKEHEACS